jgi:hypothetical protein
MHPQQTLEDGVASQRLDQRPPSWFGELHRGALLHHGVRRRGVSDCLAALVYEEVDTTAAERMEEDRDPDVLTTACIGFVFNDESVFDEEPFHDVLDNMASDLCILFNPAHVACASSAMNMECSDINIDMPVNYSTKCPSGATDVTGSNLMGFNLTTDLILDEEPTYEEESRTDILFTCSTKCVGHVVGSVAFSTVVVATFYLAQHSRHNKREDMN